MQAAYAVVRRMNPRLVLAHKCASDNQDHPPTMAELRTDNESLHRCRACFEMRSASAPRVTARGSVLDVIRKIPQPEEAAQRPSRRPQGADPACLCGLRDLRVHLHRTTVPRATCGQSPGAREE
jgi:hypothetical protein